MPRSPDPYSAFADEQLTLRDLLAVDRTALANERTVLGYIRTALALQIAGGSLLRFFGHSWTVPGWALIAVSAPVLVLGLTSFYRKRAALAPLMRNGA